MLNRARFDKLAHLQSSFIKVHSSIKTKLHSDRPWFVVQWMLQFIFGLKTSLKQNKNRNCYFSLTTLFCLLTNLRKLTRNLLLVLNKAFYFEDCSALTFKNLYSILCSFLCFFWNGTLQNVLYVFFTNFTKTRNGSHFQQLQVPSIDR